MLIRIADMKGRIPRMHPRLLPGNFAQVAENTRLEDGAIGPIKAPTTAHTFGATPQTFLKFGGSFVSFDQPGVNATAGPVAQDRLYYTGDGAPKMRVGATDYDLALNPPAAAPTTARNRPTVGDAPGLSIVYVHPPGNQVSADFQYKYAAITENGETAASGQAQIARIDGQRVHIGGMSLPDGTVSIVLYRNDLSNTDETFGKLRSYAYQEGVHGPLTDASVTDDFSLFPAYNIAPKTTGDEPTETVGAAPTLTTETITPPGGYEHAEFSYRYSAITDKGETVASEPANVLRIDGERVQLTAMSLPEGTEKIRVYRLDVGAPSSASGRYGRILEADYELATHGALNNATITDIFEALPDLSIPPKETGSDADAEEVVTYVYTFVTAFDEESAPSPASTLIKVGPIDTVTFTVAGPTQTDRNIDRMRVYRSKTSLAGVTDFYFLTELELADAGDDQTDDFEQLLNEPISSSDYDTPPSGMEGLIPLPNGLMAAFAGREVLFCEPYKPHAWPIKYRLTTDTDIVGLGAFGTFVVVLTEGAPFMVQGSDPDLMVMEKMETTLPCLSKASIVDLGYSVAYASYDGLVVVSERGAQVMSKTLFTDEQWRALRPATFRAAQRAGRYHFSYQAEVAGPWAMGIIDLSGQQPFYMEADAAPTLMYYDPPNGALYYIEGSAVVKEFDPRGGATVQKQVWRSKRTVLQGYDNFGAILIETDDVPGTKATPADPDCMTRIYADGNLVHTTTATNRADRLPSGFLAEQWEIEIEGYAPVTGISMATDIAELVGN